ncbi:MAG: beta-galactosidase [Fervidobacterium sp.]
MITRDGKFIVNGKEKFLFSAEVHYFRLPPDEWEDRLTKIKEAGFDTVSFYVPWFFHEIENGAFDFEGKSGERKNIKAFVELTKSFGLDIIFKPGPYVMSELKNEGLPEWLYNTIPHAIAKTLNGDTHPTKVFSYLHNDYLKYVKRWYDNVLQVAKDGNLLLIQIDNEVGMLQWITGQGDYNKDTIEKFKEYLKGLGDKSLLDELSNWSYGKGFSKKLLIKYHEFSRWYYFNYLKVLRRYVEESGIDVPVIVNIHGFDMVEYAKRGKNYPVGVSQLMKSALIKNVILSGDYYIGNVIHENFSDLAIANAIMYAVQSKEQPLFSAEFQSGFQLDKPKLLPSTLDLTSRLCMGNGMNGINYYMFTGGYNPKGTGLLGEYHDWQAPISADGMVRKSYYVLKELINEVKSIEHELVNSKPVFDTFFGFIPVYYATEFFKEHGVDEGDIHFKRDILIFDGVMRALKLLNVNFGGVNLQDVEIDDLKNYPSLWVFSHKWMPKSVQQKLIEYVKIGGKLIIFPELPTEDEFGNECSELIEGINVKIYEKRSWDFANVFNTEINTYHVESYKVNGEYEQFGVSNYNYVCAFRKSLGKGVIFVLGCGVEIEREYKLSIIERILEVMQIERAIKLIGEGFVDGYLRKGNKNFILFLNNYDDYIKRTKVLIYGKYYGTYEVNARSGRIITVEKDQLESGSVSI